MKPGEKITLNRRCFKIDKNNASGMIEGFEKDGKLLRTSIWCDVTRKKFPMLITLNKTKTQYKGSPYSREIDSEDFKYKYAALFDSEYFIKNDWDLWDKICNNGLFDIWIADDPYTRFKPPICKSPESKFRIVLVRLYEIEEEFKKEDTVPVSKRVDHMSSDKLRVTLKKPIISDEEFQRIKELLEETIKEYR